MAAYNGTTNNNNSHSSSSKRTPGRRQRPAASSSVTVADAKAKFVETVSRGVDVLMKECGYSRERATIAVLREISRGNGGSSSSSYSPPGEDEIFHVMHTYGISMDAATKALTVSKALQREVSERKVSMVQAIDDLTAKLSLTNLVVRMESQSAITSTPPTPCDDVPATRALIQPLVSVRKTTTGSSNSSSSSSSVRKAKPTNNSVTNSNNKKAKPNLAAGRKRSMEEVNNSNEKPPQTRERADSVTEEVNAKLAENKAKLSPSDDETRVTANTTTTTRGKRGRMEDNEVVAAAATKNTPSLKRARVTSASTPTTAGTASDR